LVNKLSSYFFFSFFLFSPSSLFHFFRPRHTDRERQRVSERLREREREMLTGREMHRERERERDREAEREIGRQREIDEKERTRSLVGLCSEGWRCDFRWNLDQIPANCRGPVADPCRNSTGFRWVFWWVRQWDDFLVDFL
jgi:hypothetical protein